MPKFAYQAWYLLKNWFWQNLAFRNDKANTGGMKEHGPIQR
jgi:hypothetical protein